MNNPKFVIVVGTSAGGLNALAELVGQLKKGMDAAVFIVMHLSRTSISNFLLHHLQPHTQYTCRVATDGLSINRGEIYIAPPNCHLLIKKNTIVLGRGPEENRWKPSIDVLFRSAAVSYNTRAIGIILTGMLDDGTAGMVAIKRSGGICIIQDPNEAEYPDMPLSVLNSIEADYCIRLADMGKIISDITNTIPEERPVPNDVLIESEIAERVVIDYNNIKKIGEQSIYACPDCGGGLWKITNDNGNQENDSRYRCHIGHAYTEKDLIIKQAEVFESTLWVALRIMEERRNLLAKMERDPCKKRTFHDCQELQRKSR